MNPFQKLDRVTNKTIVVGYKAGTLKGVVLATTKTHVWVQWDKIYHPSTAKKEDLEFAPLTAEEKVIEAALEWENIYAFIPDIPEVRALIDALNNYKKEKNLV